MKGIRLWDFLEESAIRKYKKDPTWMLVAVNIKGCHAEVRLTDGLGNEIEGVVNMPETQVSA